MRVIAVRVMMTGSVDGGVTRAVLQHYVESGNIADGTYQCVWEDVRELPISPDGVVTLGAPEPPAPIEVPQAFQDAFRDEDLQL